MDPFPQPSTKTPPPIAPLAFIADSSQPSASSRLKMTLVGLSVFILLGAISLGTYLIQQQQVFKTKAAPSAIAEVYGQPIDLTEYDQTKQFFAQMLGKSISDQEIEQKSLKFLVELRLLKKYAQDKGLLTEAESLSQNRFQGLTYNPPSTDSAQELADHSRDIYQDYVLDQSLRELINQKQVQWKIVDYLSIRYLYDDNAPEEEKAFRTTAEQKMAQYQQSVTDRDTLQAAIKERCQDKDIDFLPYDQSNKIYSKTFNGKICREQAVNLKISTSTNPMFGESWLKQVFDNTKKGEVSQVIDFTSPNLGMLFLVYVSEEGGEEFSLNELINNLKTNANIQIYNQ